MVPGLKYCVYFLPCFLKRRNYQGNLSFFFLLNFPLVGRLQGTDGSQSQLAFVPPVINNVSQPRKKKKQSECKETLLRQAEVNNVRKE